MKVVEKFISINGEGERAGELAAFIRFWGCNLACTYCDTKWANETSCPYEDLSPKDIYDYILSCNVTNVTLTGGEPLLQKDMIKLLEILLKDKSLHIEIETNGAVSIEKVAKLRDELNAYDNLSFTMDYKLISSGFEDAMILENFDYLKPVDIVKFVCESTDLERAAFVIEKYKLTDKCIVYLSPVFGKIELEEMVEFMKKNCMNKVRLQIQMHKVIWEPDKKGV
ncbi:7-carboxy-7-deazaguanine synthase [Acetitomaculum ruminis DSM 5522]|uniref:7-carboxy-7-deazaguanine synthase n=1 Tax=Acetitomaculum ruminis DSM 5522 TaxID=1120918 RepID=A0A1I0YX15_9FIRM|nr:putative 7-carboxy-7-deazaguanine synthase QueE [Acetitomaculum ruminis]SFB16613.1 7-carboxy-7-deazaguanine synthase [Acetitomaculum ruminis DSM 5522]